MEESEDSRINLHDLRLQKTITGSGSYRVRTQGARGTGEGDRLHVILFSDPNSNHVGWGRKDISARHNYQYEETYQLFSKLEDL